MIKIYKDDIFRFNQINLRKDGNVFQTILDERERKTDPKRFFLKYIPQEIVDVYDFNDKESLEQFRNMCLGFNSPLKEMGGCNLREDSLEKGIRDSGIRLSDPNGDILGAFNIAGDKIIYSPIFPRFFDERDNIKFANATYFTTMTFEEIMENQIKLAKEFYVHTGDYRKISEISKHGRYIFEKVTEEEMIDFTKNKENGKKILRKHLDIK